MTNNCGFYLNSVTFAVSASRRRFISSMETPMTVGVKSLTLVWSSNDGSVDKYHS